MVIGDVYYGDPTVHAPPWHLLEDPTALMGHHCVPVSGVSCRANTGAVSPYVLGEAALAALRLSLVPPPPPPPPPPPQPQQQRQRQYVEGSYDSSSSSSEEEEEEEEEGWGSDSWEAYATDEFRMYEFKVRACRRRRSHNWTECPFAHPGEKAARRDPRRFAYSGEPCPEFRRRGACERGDACDLAHGVFECWLHPARYRTQPCKDGTACRRPVCFFAHTLSQLRLLLPPHHHHHPTNAPSSCCSANKSRGRRMKPKRFFSSPPISPALSPAGNRSEREDVEAAMAELRLCKSMPSSWKYRTNATAFGTGMHSSSSSNGAGAPSTMVMAPEQYYSWCAEDSVAEESAGEEMSAPNFDWVSDLLQ